MVDDLSNSSLRQIFVVCVERRKTIPTLACESESALADLLVVVVVDSVARLDPKDLQHGHDLR